MSASSELLVEIKQMIRVRKRYRENERESSGDPTMHLLRTKRYERERDGPTTAALETNDRGKTERDFANYVARPAVATSVLTVGGDYQTNA